MTGLNATIELSSFEGNFLRRMNAMRKENRRCNVTITVKKKVFTCHDIVLVTASSYFETMLNGNFMESSYREDITINDIEPEAFEEILSAIYTCKFHLHQGNAYYIIKASHMLQMNEILEASIKCIMQNTNIDYLIETCSFASTIGREELYRKCLKRITKDLENVSKIDTFNEQIPFDTFREMLQCKDAAIDEETVLELILRWNGYHKRNREEILILMAAANLPMKITSAAMIAAFIANEAFGTNNVCCCQSLSSSENVKVDQPAVSVSRDSVFETVHNIYMDVINAKTGTKGFICLQADVNFKKYKISDFQPLIFSHIKCKKFANDWYCFGYDEDEKRNLFSVFENGQHICLAVPPGVFQYCDMEAISGYIYLINEVCQLWRYIINDNKWTLVCYCGNPQSYSYHDDANRYVGHVCFLRQSMKCSSPKLIYCKNTSEMYIVGFGKGGKKIIRILSGLSKQSHFRYDASMGMITIPNDHENAAVCYYDEKLLICGSDSDGPLHRTVDVFDVPNKKWSTIESMNIGRANHTVNYHDGFIYVVENKSMIPNERYNIKSKKWEPTRPLPQRLHFVDEDITWVTGKVFNYTVETS